MTSRFTVTDVTAADHRGLDALCGLSDDAEEALFGVRPVTLPDLWRTQISDGRYFANRFWVAWDGATPVGFAHLTLPQKEDLDQAFVELCVPPVHRGRGAGRLLVEAAVRPAVLESGRGTVSTFSEVPLEGDTANSLTRDVGLELKSAEITQVLPLPLGAERFVELHDAAVASFGGYRIEGWIGNVPEQYMEQWCELGNEFNAGLPLEDLESEVPVSTPERVRERDKHREACGHALVTSAAFSPAGDLVAVAQAEVSLGTGSALALQANLIVTEAHRGHRLGMAVKLEGLRLLHEHFPGVTAIATWNSQVNEHALALNREIGFRRIGREVAYQGSVR
ncbi:MAG: GNAT family N-acetyltransferase [Corynebacterium sp.]|uniref:GNAT family N-acetyltransferase n=1 Tax=Corynebacterium sp. TaxID=1720 RepID=UPI003F9C7251